MMETLCPNCKKALPDGCEGFCPWCDCDLSRFEASGTNTEKPSPSAPGAGGGVPPRSLEPPSGVGAGPSRTVFGSQAACPSCKRALPDDCEEFCPWCDCDLSKSHAAGTQAAEPSPSSFRSGAGTPPRPPEADAGPKPAASGINADPGPEPPASGTGQMPSPPPGGDVPPPPAAPARPAVPAPPAAVMPSTPDEEWDMNGIPPLALWFDAGAVFRQNCRSVLSFAVRNQCSLRLKNVRLTVDTGSGDTLPDNKPLSLMPGGEAEVPVRNFKPEDKGQYSLRLVLSGVADGPGEFRLVGEVSIAVLPEKDVEVPQQFNLHINAEGPSIIRAENALAEMRNAMASTTRDAPQEVRCVEVGVYWDTAYMDAQKRFLPAATWDPSLFSIPGETSRILRAMAPRSAPQGLVSTELGNAYRIVAGSQLTLGTEKHLSDIPATLLPLNQFAQQNGMISRSHCQLVIEKNKLFVLDNSSNGTFIGNALVGRGNRVQVGNGDVISLARQLNLKVSIHTDGKTIQSVKLSRINNKPQEAYVLCPGYVVLGGGTGVPVCVPGAPEVAYAFYYNPRENGWVQMEPGTADGLGLLVDKYVEMEFAGKKCWFMVQQ